MALTRRVPVPPTVRPPFTTSTKSAEPRGKRR